MKSLDELATDPVSSDSDETSTTRKNNLTNRVVSAVIAFPFLFICIWQGGIWLIVLLVALAILGTLELLALFGIRSVWLRALWSGFAAVIVLDLGSWILTWVLSTSETVPIWTLFFCYFGLGIVLLSFWFLIDALKSRPRSFQAYITNKNALFIMVGSLYIGLTLSHAILLRNLDNGELWLSLAVIAVFAVDSSAYFVGSCIGKRQMAPKISPNKTWEGAIAGMAGGVITVLAFTSLSSLSLSINVGNVTSLGLVIGLAAQVGDLIESKIKRMQNVKESGGLIPGHGGVLDRLDSVLLPLVFVYHGVGWLTIL
jgi:phosphatidate cytidylyltransferase